MKNLVSLFILLFISFISLGAYESLYVQTSAKEKENMHMAMSYTHM